MNRKGYYSLQLQLIANEDLKILDEIIGYPGSVHDTRVFRELDIFKKLPEICGGKLLNMILHLLLLCNVYICYRLVSFIRRQCLSVLAANHGSI